MLSIAVPASLKLLVLAQVPDALVIVCPETDSGAIYSLAELDLQKYQAIVCGCGLSLDASSVVKQTIDSDIPLVLDADALNATVLAVKLGVGSINLTQETASVKRAMPQTILILLFITINLIVFQVKLWPS